MKKLRILLLILNILLLGYLAYLAFFAHSLNVTTHLRRWFGFSFSILFILIIKDLINVLPAHFQKIQQDISNKSLVKELERIEKKVDFNFSVIFWLVSIFFIVTIWIIQLLKMK